MSKNGKNQREKRKRYFSIMEEEDNTEEKEFSEYSMSEKSLFFKMLKDYKRVNSQKKMEKITPKKDEDLKRKQRFKIQIPVKPNSNKNNILSKEEQEELVIEINSKIMKSILDAKWDKIELEEGCLEEVLDWIEPNDNPEKDVIYKEDGHEEYFLKDFKQTFFGEGNSDSRGFDL